MEEVTESLRESNLEAGYDGSQDVGQSTKHMLTPESKSSAESVPKRFAAMSHGNISREEARALMCVKISNVLISNPGAYVKQKDIMNLLELCDADKALLTRCIKLCFRESAKKIVVVDKESQAVYSNVAFKSEHPSTSQCAAKQLFSDEDDDITQIRKQIAEAEEQLINEWTVIRQAISEQDIDQVKCSTMQYHSSLEIYMKLNAAIIQVYSKKIEALKQQNIEGTINSSQKEQLKKEFKALESLCQLDLEGGDLSHVLHSEVFSRLLDNFEETCPLIYSVLHSLLISDSDLRQRVHKTPRYKMTCGVNSLVLLLSVRNQKCSNDIRLLLGLLMVTYGAGKQFINMSHSIGLTPHWDTIVHFLDKRSEQLEKSVLQRCDDSKPVILLMDNINMYRGRKRHDRLFAEVGPKMWNFTGRAAIIPDLTDLKDLLACEETTTCSQIDMSTLKVKDILLDSMPDHMSSWEEWCDNYYLQLLDMTLNKLPAPPKELKEMNETEVNSWLRDINVEETNARQTYDIKVSPNSTFCNNMQANEKTNVFNLPLSLEDNSTLLGTAALFETFSKEFDIPCDDLSNYIEFDENSKEFNIASARERSLFLKSLQEHRNQMKNLEKQMVMHEKDIEKTELNFHDSESEHSDDSDSDAFTSTSRKPPNEDFDKLFHSIVEKTQEATRSGDESLLDATVQDVSKLTKELESVRDKFGRTVLHAAVEQRNITLTKILISSGVNPNAKELCGATPLSIAVINADVNICELLVSNFAVFKGEMFGDFPSPLTMATTMELSRIIDLFQLYSRNLVSPVVKMMQYSEVNTPTPAEYEMKDCASDKARESNHFIFKRSQCKEFPTAVVGDVGTCKNNRSVRNKDCSRYGWSTEVPGDMHTKGYLCEAVFKAQGVGGFHKVVNSVMNRPKLTKEAFKKRKFQDNNLNRIKESVRDGSIAYGMSAVQEFLKSSEFPTKNDMSKDLRKFGSHNHILLQRFKKWLKECAECNPRHKYHQQLFTLFGPLLELFITAGKYGDGHLREVVWVILLPVFANLGFRNYWTEAFVHVVNFTALWPLAFRHMIRSNSTVNLSGKFGHNVDLDEYVETYIVRPLKTYVTGHTSVQMCKRLMGNLDVLGSTRKTYASRQAFDHHTTTQHKEQSSFPDQIKGMWFCMRNGFFDVSGDTVPYVFPLKGPAIQKPVQKAFLNVKENGEAKVKEKFEEKLHDCFPSFRKLSFERAANVPSSS